MSYPLTVRAVMPAADWASQNPPINQFEACVESDTGDVKVNWSSVPTAFNSLGYLNPSGPSSIPYDLACQFIGVPASSAVGLRFVAVRAFTLKASGQKGTAGTAATAQADFIVAVNGTTKATLRFAASGSTITVVGGVAAVIAAGDIITITAPASADGTLADIGFTLTGTLL